MTYTLTVLFPGGASPMPDYDTEREAAGIEARLQEVIAERDGLEAQLKEALVPPTADVFEAQFAGLLWSERPCVVNTGELDRLVQCETDLKAEVTDLTARLESSRTLAEHAETCRREALAGLSTSSIVTHLEAQSARQVETIDALVREKDALRAEVESRTTALRQAVRSRDSIEREYHAALDSITTQRECLAHDRNRTQTPKTTTVAPEAKTEWRTHDGTRASVQALCGWYNLHVPGELRVERRLLGGGFAVSAHNGRPLGPEGRRFVCAGEPLSVTHHTLASEG